MNWKTQVGRCLCGKICTSKPGLTLHQKVCEVAQKALRGGQPAIHESGVIGPAIDYIDEVREMVDLVNELACDANEAITNKNKSAGRRARIRLLELRDHITPLRKKILDSISKSE